MKIWLTATALIATSTAAYAQTATCMNNGPFVNCNGSDGSFTTCNRTGTIVNCNTMGGLDDGLPAARYDGNGSGAGLADVIHAIHARKVRARVMKALQAGDCPTALRESTGADDIDFALKVQRYCSNTASQTKSSDR